MKRLLGKMPALFQSGQWHFHKEIHQSTTPSLSQIIWPRWVSTQFLTLPIVQILHPVTFAYSLSPKKNLEAVVMRQLRRWKRLWRRSLIRSHKRTSMGHSRTYWNGVKSALQPEAITSRGLEFHVCTINKSAHTKTVWILILDPSYIRKHVIFWSGIIFSKMKYNRISYLYL